jgi:hypothetical protein
MSNPTAATIEFTPLSNGLDFILTALEQLSGSADARRVKYGILHLSAGMELIFKERLRREHWSLVFDNIERANEKEYASGDFISVTFDKCLQRLCGISGIQISDEEIKRLNNLRKKRNRLEHFGITDSLMAVKAVASYALGIIIDFINDELSPLDADDAQTFEHIRELLGEFDKFVLDRWKEIKNEVESATTAVVECPRCSQEALVIDDGVHCLFCRYQEESATAAADTYITSVLGLNHYRTVKHGGRWPHYDCPSCSADAMVATDEEFICFGCGGQFESGEIGYCDTCGEPYFPGDDEDYEPMCSNCITNYSA